MKHVFILILTLSLGTTAFCIDLSLEGFADVYGAARFDDSEYNALRTRLRQSISAQYDRSYLFASLNAEKNHVIKEKSGIELREAYLEYTADSWDMRVGRQIISWGKADGIQITDIICPGDYTEYITRDFDDIRMPVDAVQFRLLPLWGSFEAIWLPTFEPAVLPSGDSPWKVGKVSEIEAIEPEKNLENSEVAGKLSIFAPGFDIAVSAFYTWDDQPAYHRIESGDSVSWEPRFHRLQFYGLELTKPVGKFVLRGETAFYTGKRLTDQSAPDRVTEKELLKGMLGTDWYPNADWTLSAQVACDWIPDYTDGLDDEEYESLGTLRISRNFLRETLEVSNMAYYSFTERDFYDQIKVDYEISDGLHALAGVDLFGGNEDGDFGQYEDNSQAWLKIKYSY